MRFGLIISARMKAEFSRNHPASSLILFVLALFLAGNLSGQFVPNDPFFNPGKNGVLKSPRYFGQWHLLNQMPLNNRNAGLDANVWGAWQRGLTGQGVIISIVDDGTQGDHPEFIEKFRNEFSWDYGEDVETNNQQEFRGMPFTDVDNHGTAVAGVAAAQGGNGIGVTGAAPFAQIAAQRLLIASWSEEDFIELGNLFEAQAIGFQGQQNSDGLFDPSVPFTGEVVPVRVMNHSYGPDRGYELLKNYEKIHPALAASAEKNVLHLFAAGNQRGTYTTQDSNTILANTSPDVIVVAALGSNGIYSDYSSFGANVLVTAPSDSSAGLFAIATADRTGLEGYNSFEDGEDPFFSPVRRDDIGDYVSQFGGTSSATPLASGIMALGVEAYPELNLRIARHLLTRTSFFVNPGDSDWVLNAAGLYFNRSYGFGLIDADAFTLRAPMVRSISPLTVYQQPKQLLEGQVFGPENLSLTQSFQVNQTDALPIEYVQVQISLSGLQPEENFRAYLEGEGAVLGDISGVLSSPMGTTYQLFWDDRNVSKGRAVQDTLEWTYISYAYYGESMNGEWTLTLNNASPNWNSTNFGVWDSFQLTFGTGLIFSGHDWVGLGGSENWDTAANWSPGEVPQPGDPVFFAGSQQTFVDTMTHRIVGDITFTGTAGSFFLTENSLELNGDITNFSANSQTITSRIVLGTDSTFRAVRGGLFLYDIELSNSSGVHSLTFDGQGDATVLGEISNAAGSGGQVIKTGVGKLVFSGPKSFSGTTTVRNGVLSTADLPSSKVRMEGGWLSPGGSFVSRSIEVGGLELEGGGMMFDLLARSSDRIAVGEQGVSGTASTTFAFNIWNFQPGRFTLMNGNGVEFLDPRQFGFTANLQGLVGRFLISGDSLVFAASHSGFVSGPILSNSAPVFTPEFAVFVVDGFAKTSPQTASNAIAGLLFQPDSELQVFNELTVTGGGFDVPNGSAVLAGGLVTTPNEFSKIGAGTLVLNSDTRVGEDLEIRSGGLLVNGELEVRGDALVDRSYFELNGEAVVDGDFQSRESTNLVNGEFLVKGQSILSGGELAIQGTMQSNGGLSMRNNSLLSGSGLFVGDLLNAAVVNPGSSPGTLTIDGNFTQTAAGTLLIEAASPNDFDQLIVRGGAKLAGTLDFQTLNGFTPEYGQQFPFLRARNVMGGFESVLVPETYRGRVLPNGSSLVLLLAPDSYTRLAQTPNQTRAAAALDSFRFAVSGDEETVAIALDVQSASQYAAAFEAVSPAFHQTVTDLGIALAQSQGQILQQQFSSFRFAGRGFRSGALPLEPLQYDKNGARVPDPKSGALPLETTADPRWSVWAQGNGVFGRTNSVSELGKARFESGGFLVGTDYAWGPSLTTGLFAGYQGACSSYGEGFDIRMNGVRFGGYASFDPENSGFYADAAVWGGSSQNRVRRAVRFSTIDRVASSNQTSNELSALLGTGYDWNIGRFTFGPAVSAQFTQFSVNSFTENGAESLNLRISGQSAQSLETYLGGRVAYTFNITPALTVIPELRMFWQHEFLQNGRTINAQLNGGSGAGFGFETSAIQRDAVWAGVGLTVGFKDRWAGYAYYNNDFGSSSFQAVSVNGGLRVEF